MNEAEGGAVVTTVEVLELAGSEVVDIVTGVEMLVVGAATGWMDGGCEGLGLGVFGC